MFTPSETWNNSFNSRVTAYRYPFIPEEITVFVHFSDYTDLVPQRARVLVISIYKISRKNRLMRR